MALTLQAVRFNFKRFVKIMMLMIECGAFKLRLRQSLQINIFPRFAKSSLRYRFTTNQLQRLQLVLGVPGRLKTTAGDVVSGLEAIALVCRRLAEPSRLFTIASEFGRSVPACSRIISAMVDILYQRHRALLFFNLPLVEKNFDKNCSAVYSQGTPLRNAGPLLMAPSNTLPDLALVIMLTVNMRTYSALSIMGTLVATASIGRGSQPPTG
jgi:hypothetical protein